MATASLDSLLASIAKSCMQTGAGRCIQITRRFTPIAGFIWHGSARYLCHRITAPLAACIPSLKCANDTQQRRQILYVLMTRKEDTKPFPCVVLAVPAAQSWTDGVDHRWHRKAAAAVVAASSCTCSVLLQQRKRTEQSHAGYFRVAG